MVKKSLVWLWKKQSFSKKISYFGLCSAIQIGQQKWILDILDDFIASV